MRYIDIHAHVNFQAYDTDRDAVMARLSDAEVGVINIGSNMENSALAVDLAHQYENTWAIIGLHPVHEGDPFDIEKMQELLGDPRVVGIGECGLDYFRGRDNVVEQRELFGAHVQLGIQHGKPIMLHTRPTPGTTDAYEDLLALVRGYKNDHPDLHFHLHFYAGGEVLAREFLALGCTFSFTGVITFTHDYDAVIRMLPIESIMSETDCPYVTPAPHRGQRNEPVYVIEVVKKIAEIKNLPIEEVEGQMVENAKRVFGL